MAGQHVAAAHPLKLHASLSLICLPHTTRPSVPLAMLFRLALAFPRGSALISQSRFIAPSSSIVAVRFLVAKAGMTKSTGAKTAVATKTKVKATTKAAAQRETKKVTPKKKTPTKAMKAVKPKAEPKRTVLVYPDGPKTAINFFHQELASQDRPADLQAAQELMKRMTVAWNSMSESEKQKYFDQADRDSVRYKQELGTWRVSLSPEDITRERKVQAYRRSVGKPIPRASRYATRPQRKVNAPLTPYISFSKEMWENEGRAVQICGGAWMGADMKERARLLGKTWKSMSPDEKSSYAEA